MLQTYNETGESRAKYHTIKTKNPDVILAFNDPLRESNAHRDFLTSIGMTVKLEIAADIFISKAVERSEII